MPLLPPGLKAKRELLLPHPDNPFTPGDLIWKSDQGLTYLPPQIGVVSGTHLADACDITWDDGGYSPISNQHILISELRPERILKKRSQVLSYLYDPDNPFNTGDLVRKDRGRLGVISYLINAHLCVVSYADGEDRQVLIESLELEDPAPCPYSEAELRQLI